MKIISFFAIIGILCIGLFFVFYSKKHTDLSRKELSFRDQLGQMLIIGFDGTEFTPAVEKLFKKIHPGGVLLLSRNIKNAVQLQKLTSDLQTFSLRETGQPLFIAVDQEGGEIARISWVEHTSQSELFDTQEGYVIGERRSKELQEMGVNMNLAPVLDSAENGDFIYGRSFRKSSSESFPIAAGLLEGHRSNGVIPVSKHFPGYGNLAENPEQGRVPSIKSMPDISLFTEIFKEYPLSFVMVSHVIYEDADRNRPFPFSRDGIQFLRETLGDEVLVMSDDLLSPALLSQYSLRDIGVQVLQGGINVLLIAGYPDAERVLEFVEELREGVQERKDLHSFIKFSAEKIVKVKETLNSSK